MNCFRGEGLLVATWKVASCIAEAPLSVHVQKEHDDEDTHAQAGPEHRRFHGNCKTEFRKIALVEGSEKKN